MWWKSSSSLGMESWKYSGVFETKALPMEELNLTLRFHVQTISSCDSALSSFFIVYHRRMFRDRVYKWIKKTKAGGFFAWTWQIHSLPPYSLSFSCAGTQVCIPSQNTWHCKIKICALTMDTGHCNSSASRKNSVSLILINSIPIKNNIEAFKASFAQSSSWIYKWFSVGHFLSYQNSHLGDLVAHEVTEA